METVYYITEVLAQAWPIILIMGMIAIPILFIWFNEDDEYEPLDDYYVKSAKEQIEKIKSKEDICDN